MAVRRWQIPATVAIAARAEAELSGDPLHRDLAARLPVTATSLVAAATSPDPMIADWATSYYRRLYRESEDRIDRALVAAGYGDCYGCDPEHTAYGILDPLALQRGQEVVSQVIRRTADGGLERWEGSGWASVPDELHPTGLQSIELNSEMLADLIELLARGAGLMLRPTQPRGFLSIEPTTSPAIMAAADAAAEPPVDRSDAVFATVDEMDSSAVLSLFTVLPGPVIHVRVNGAWVPDDGHTLATLESSDPPTVVQVPPADVQNVLRQVDDHDSTHPQPTPKPLTAGADYNGVMVALPVPADLAYQLAVPGGEDPADMHVTLAYLGSQDEAGIEPDDLLDLVKQWAVDHPDAFDGSISGPGVFKPSDSDGEPAHVALVDCPALPDARQDLVRRLQAAGANVMLDHGYTPHITRAYGDVALADPETDGKTAPTSMDLDHQPINLDHIGVYFGNDRGYIPLGDPDDAFDPDRNDSPTAPLVAALWNEQLHPRQGGKFASKGAQAQPAAPPPDTAQANYIATGNTTGVPKNELVPGKKAKAGGSSGAKAARAQKAGAAKLAAAKARRIAAVQKRYTAQHAAAKVRQQNSLDQYALQRAKADATEQAHRDKFDTGLNDMFQHLKTQGLSDNDAALKVQQAAQAEVQRRQSWEIDRKRTVADENIRRIQARIITRSNMLRDNQQMAHEIALVAGAGAAKPEHSQMPTAFQRYWTVGKGAVKIRWGSSGDFNRCRRALAKYVHNPHALDGACANLHRLITMSWPGPHAHDGGAARRLARA